MPIDLPKSDLSRSVLHEPSHQWPESVKIQLLWRDKDGKPVVSTQIVSADQFFGTGQYGAPLEGQAIIQMIERLRRQGPPEVKRKPRKGAK